MSSSHTRLLGIVGTLTAIAFFVGIVFDLLWLRLLTKPFPVLCMAAWIWPQIREDRYAKWIFVGLLFSVMGDILLEIPANLFLFGLIAFLLAHIGYILAYTSETRQLRAALSVPFFAYGAGLCGFLFAYGHVGGLRIPVAIYATVICAMMWRAAARYGLATISRISMHSALIGAILFAISDSMIAINKFYAPFPASRYLIIALYWAGQLSIAMSVRR